MPKKLSAAAATKRKLRLKIKALRISASQRKKSSAAVCRKLARSSFFRDAASLAFYAAGKDEIDLSPLAAKALKLKKKVYFPRMAGKKIEFRAVRNLKLDFETGAYGIAEPKVRRTRKISAAPEVIFVPGRAFDADGVRLGRGGGHYDRLLARWKQSVRVGVAFRAQKVKRLPSEKHDVAMDAVVTS